DVFLSFIFPIIDLLLLLLGVTLIFRPAIFNAKSKLFIFILVLTGLAITDYLYFYLQGDLSERSVIFLRCLYRVFLLFIAIAATIPKNTS
ncbi:TPA: GGDEF domain-containing protein, partial [Bacillus thuringiensis]|nr:GGDEF domain-containing protein [Bacillus thuringiensis]